MVNGLVGYVGSGVVPVVRCAKRLELVIDSRLERPVVAVSGKGAEVMCSVLSKKFLTRHNGRGEEILVPVHALPAVGVWLLVSYRTKPSEELLEKLLYRTPTVLADLFWDLVTLSDGVNSDDGEPLINRSVLIEASKIARKLLKLYKVI